MDSFFLIQSRISKFCIIDPISLRITDKGSVWIPTIEFAESTDCLEVAFSSVFLLREIFFDRSVKFLSPSTSLPSFLLPCSGLLVLHDDELSKHSEAEESKVILSSLKNLRREEPIRLKILLFHTKSTVTLLRVWHSYDDKNDQNNQNY